MNRGRQVTKKQELGLNNNKKKFDIREEYYVRITSSFAFLNPQTFTQRLSAAQDDVWENKRIPRPAGLGDSVKVYHSTSLPRS